MMKNIRLVVVLLFASLSYSTLSQAALSSSARLDFNPGVAECDPVSGCPFTSGSYFVVDTDGGGVFDIYERIGISPGTDGGLLIGQSQLAANSHSGGTDGSEIAPFDAPWLFLGNTGMHQSTTPVNIISDDGFGNVELDFSGWGALWNGLEIGLGGDSVNFSDTGIGILSCNVDCSNGDSFVLDYMAHVNLDDPAGFGGVYWGLHLEGTVSTVPVPAAVWLFGSGLIALAGCLRRRK